MDLIFFPKWSVLSGASAGTIYYSSEIDIAGFSIITLDILTKHITTGGALSCLVQASQDLENWTTAAAAQTCTAGTVKTFTASNTARYIRLQATVQSADDTVATFYAEGTARVST